MDKKNIYPIILLLTGVTLTGLGMAEILDEFWSGMGSALFIIGAIRLLRYHRLKNNRVYRERMETDINDERNQFIRAKAWSWSGYIFIICAGVFTIIFKLLGNDLLCQASSCGVCMMLVLYWISYLVLNKKY